MKRMTKLLSAFLAAMLLLSCCSALAAEDDSILTEPGTYPIVTEPVTLTAYVQGRADHEFFKYLEEKTGVHLDIVTSVEDPTESVQKRNVIMNGDYPDIFLGGFYDGFYPADVTKYGMEEEIIIPVEGMIDDYTYWYKQLRDENPAYFAGTVASDGHVYGFVEWRQGSDIWANSKTYVNTKLLEQTGKEMPTTVDEFIDLLRAFKALGDDIIPWSATTISTFGAYLVESYLPMDMIVNTCTSITEDNTVVYGATQDAFREALKVMHDLYAEGLIDPAAFTADYDTGKAMSAQGNIGVFEVQNLSCIQNEDPETYNNYRLMLPVKGPEGVQYTSTVSPLNYSAVIFGAISDTCEHPEVAARWLDCFYDPEVTYTKTFGLEGIGWDWNTDESRKSIDGSTLTIVRHTQSESGLSDEEWAVKGPFGDTAPSNKTYKVWDGSKELYEGDELYTNNVYMATRSYYEAKELEPYFHKALPCRVYIPDSAKFDSELAELWSYFLSAYSEFIMGTRDPYDDAQWEAYKKDLEALGVEDYIEQWNIGMQNWLANGGAF